MTSKVNEDRRPVRILTAMPSDTNPDGDIFGGWLMSQMDLAAGAVAKRRAGGRCVTVAVEGFKFIAPVHVGDEVLIYADIEREGTSSMNIKVCTYAAAGCTGIETKVCEAIYIFVHIGADGRPKPMPLGAGEANASGIIMESKFNIKITDGYTMISRFYGDRRSARSQVLLMDHIHQGIKILERIGADSYTQEAYAVHPIFQADADLKENWSQASYLDPEIMLLVIEYRNIANQFLSDKIRMNKWGPEPICDITLSPIDEVNQMLIADKVQNRKDFLEYHKDSHLRSAELDLYFRLWLECLGVTEEKYQDLIKDL